MLKVCLGVFAGVVFEGLSVLRVCLGVCGCV